MTSDNADPQQSRRWSTRLEQLLELAVSPTQRVPRSDLQQQLVTMATELCGCQQAMLFELDDRSFEFVVVASRGVPPGPSELTRVRLGKGTFGQFPARADAQ